MAPTTLRGRALAARRAAWAEQMTSFAAAVAWVALAIVASSAAWAAVGACSLAIAGGGVGAALATEASSSLLPWETAAQNGTSRTYPFLATTIKFYLK